MCYVVLPWIKGISGLGYLGGCSGCHVLDRGSWYLVQESRSWGTGHIDGSILFANHKANGVVTNIGLSR